MAPKKRMDRKRASKLSGSLKEDDDQYFHSPLPYSPGFQATATDQDQGHETPVRAITMGPAANFISDSAIQPTSIEWTELNNVEGCWERVTFEYADGTCSEQNVQFWFCGICRTDDHDVHECPQLGQDRAEPEPKLEPEVKGKGKGKGKGKIRV
jgi:hypothetical protein